MPEVDTAYRFNVDTTRAVLMGFQHNRRVLLQGYHGTGKSSHIEQIAAHLNWPCVRLNLDSHITRMDLLGRDAIVLMDSKQITEFQDGILPWAMQRPVALVLDEYDAGRPDVMFVIQRILEVDGKLTLPDQNRIITAHPQFRLFATANTVGLGDSGGLYHGTQLLNQGQLDRWHITARLNYLSPEQELEILHSRQPAFGSVEGTAKAKAMIALANMTRAAFVNQDVCTVMSPRTVISWAENTQLFDGDVAAAFLVSYVNRCDETEHEILAEFFQRCFGEELVL